LREGKGKEVQQEGERRERKRYLLLDVIEEVKVSAKQGNLDEDVESDDHDSAEDLEHYQLNEFNNLVVAGRERLRKAERRFVEEEEEIFEMPQTEEAETE
jgi:hypothetical protein